MKSILIIGVNGFIGKALYNALSAEYNVTGASRNNVNKFDNWVSVDLLSKEDLLGFFKENRFDVIINLASVLANQSNLNDLSVFYDNLRMQSNLAESLADYGSCHFINFCSSAVYPNITGSFSEDSRIDPSCNPDGLYGLAKFGGEMIFKMILSKEVSQLHLRTGLVYGDGMNPTRIHPMFRRELINDNQITVFGRGLRTIPQIEIQSLCKKIKYFITSETIGTFNFADENVSLKVLAETIISKYGKKDSKIVFKVEGNSREFKLDLKKLNKLFND